MRLLELGSLVKGRLNVREAAVSAMRSLHKLTGQTINLSVQQGDEIVYIERAWSERSGMQVVRAIGGRAPLHLTSTGKLFLSTGDTRQVRAYALRTGLAGHTRNSLTDLERLERELALVRRHGYARDNEELELGVRCIAAGIFDDTGKLVAGLSISAPAERLQDEWIKSLVDTAASISGGAGLRTAGLGRRQWTEPAGRDIARLSLRAAGLPRLQSVCPGANQRPAKAPFCERGFLRG